MAAIDNLKKTVTKLMHNIHNVEASYELVHATDPFLQGIKQAGYDELIGFLQTAVEEHMFLNVCKAFDHDPKSHSFSRILKILDEKSANWSIKNRTKLVKELEVKFGFDEARTKCGDERLTDNIISFLKLESPAPKGTNKHSSTLEKVRERRDKLIAHNECLPLGWKTKVEKDNFLSLLDFAKTFISVISIGYLDDDGAYGPSHEKFVAACQLQRLLTKAGIPKTSD